MNALSSLVRTIWVAMFALVSVGFLVADRYRITQELTESRQKIVELEEQLAQIGQQVQATLAQLEQDLAGERGLRAQAEEAAQGIPQLKQDVDRLAAEVRQWQAVAVEKEQELAAEQAQRQQAEDRIRALEQQPVANQQAPAGCQTPDDRQPAAGPGNESVKTTGELAAASFPNLPGWTGAVLLSLAAGTLIFFAGLIYRQPVRRRPAARTTTQAHPEKPHLRPLVLRRRTAGVPGRFYGRRPVDYNQDHDPRYRRGRIRRPLADAPIGKVR